uniref:DUF6923 family protein n=1 Tax=Leucobacter chinensis TaxID=2851010 RepID=UPI001C230644
MKKIHQQIPIESTDSPPRRPKKKKLMYGSLITTSLVALGLISVPTAAIAAAGEPFDPDVPKIILVQGQRGLETRSTYHEVTVDTKTGEWKFSDPIELVPDKPDYVVNGIGYNPHDGYVYGLYFPNQIMVRSPEIVKIGQDGVLEATGKRLMRPGGWSGDIDPDTGKYYVSYGTSQKPLGISVIDLSLSVDEHNAREMDESSRIEIPIVGEQVGHDWVFHEGFLWSVNQEGALIRTNPSTGQSDAVAADVSPGMSGAIWVMGNGNIGISHNSSGRITQVRVSGDIAGTPEVKVIGYTQGPENLYNDGTAIPGLPADLKLLKSGPDRFMVGDSIIFEFTVKNVGATHSSGWLIDDLLPVGLSNPVLKDSSGVSLATEVTESRTRVFLTGAELAPGAEKTIRLEVDTADKLADYGDLGADRCFVNTAELWGNEEDPQLEDNSAKTQCVVPYDSRIELKKSVSAIEDVNGNGITDAGDRITWKFEVTNTGKSPLTGVELVDQLLQDNGITINGGKGALDVGESTTFSSAPYTITEQDAEAGEVKNVAVAKGHTDSGVPSDPESNESKTVTPVEPTPNPGSNVNASASASASAKSTADGDPAVKAAAEAAAKPDAQTAAKAAADVTAKAAAEAAADPDASTAASADVSSDPSAAAQVSAQVSADGTEKSAQDAQASVQANADASSAAKAAAETSSSADASVDFKAKADADADPKAKAKADADADADPKAKANVNASASASASAKSTADGDPAVKAA